MSLENLDKKPQHVVEHLPLSSAFLLELHPSHEDSDSVVDLLELDHPKNNRPRAGSDRDLHAHLVLSEKYWVEEDHLNLILVYQERHYEESSAARRTAPASTST